MKQTIKTVCNIVMILLIISLIGFGASIQHGINENTYIGGYKAVVVISGSMEPAIMTNSLNVATEVNNIDNINIGDVIMFKSSVGVVSHRVIGKETYNGKEYLQTKGDNNKEADGILVDESKIVGKIIYTINWIAPIINYLNRDGNVVAAMYKLIIACIMLVTVLVYFKDPTIKFIKGMYLVAHPKYFETNELSVISKVNEYEKQLKYIQSSLVNKHKLTYPYHLGKALESIDDIKKSLDDLENRINKMSR